MPPTIRPRAGFVVRAAIQPSAVMPSSIGSSFGPTPRIWKKWSMTQRESKPAASAVVTTRPSVGPISGVPPGQVNDGTWSPNFIAALLGEQVHVARHEDVLDRAFAATERGSADDGHGPEI